MAGRLVSLYRRTQKGRESSRSGFLRRRGVAFRGAFFFAGILPLRYGCSQHGARPSIGISAVHVSAAFAEPAQRRQNFLIALSSLARGFAARVPRRKGYRGHASSGHLATNFLLPPWQRRHVLRMALMGLIRSGDIHSSCV